MEKEENKYVKEPDPLPNTSGLDDIFNVHLEHNQVIDADTGQVIDTDTGEIMAEVAEMRKELKEIEDSLPDVDGIILNNIDRANRLLDKLEDDITGDRGSYSASLIDACGKLIDSVTNAANSITGMNYNNEVLRQKDRDLDRKEKELAIKGIVKGADNVTVNNNTLVMNREELMKMLAEEEGDK